MKNYYIINKDEIVEEAKGIWNLVKHDYTLKNPLVRKSFASSSTFWQVQLDPEYFVLEVKNFRSKFKEITNEGCLIDFYLGSPIDYRSNPHIDRGRRVAINIPIEVDLEASATYFGKYTDLEMYEHSRTERKFYAEMTDKDGKVVETIHPEWKGVFLPELYDIVELKTPVLFNPGKPHGGFNRSSTMRVIMSLSWKHTTFEDFVTGCKNLSWIEDA